MINWVRHKLLNFLTGDTAKYANDIAIPKQTISARTDSIDMDNCLRFNVLSCQGGIVVQLHKYDHKKDRSDNATYVIPEHEDVTQRIAQIVSMELLKH